MDRKRLFLAAVIILLFSVVVIALFFLLYHSKVTIIQLPASIFVIWLGQIIAAFVALLLSKLTRITKTSEQ